MDMNIPVVQPEWLKGCEKEGRLVGVRGYYLNAERPRQDSQGQALQRKPSSQNVPQQQRPIPERQRSHGSTARSQTLPTTHVTPPTPEVPSAPNLDPETKPNGRETPTPAPSAKSEANAEEAPTTAAPSTPAVEALEKGEQGADDSEPPEQADAKGAKEEPNEAVEAGIEPDAKQQEEPLEPEAQRKDGVEDTEGQEMFDEVKL